MMTNELDGNEFWAIKQETDDIVLLLGWSKAYCKRYIQRYYGCRSRLTMTDCQLLDLLRVLRELRAKKLESSKKVAKRRSRRRI